MPKEKKQRNSKRTQLGIIEREWYPYLKLHRTSQITLCALTLNEVYIMCEKHTLPYWKSFDTTTSIRTLIKQLTWMMFKQLYADTLGKWYISLPTKGPPTIIATLVKKPITTTDKRLGWIKAMAEGQAKFQSRSTTFVIKQLA